MSMSSETANRYFQGKENIAIAIARRRIKAGGDVKAALAMIPITKPLSRAIGRWSPRIIRIWKSDRQPPFFARHY